MKFARIHLFSYLCFGIVTGMLCATANSQDVKSVVVAKVTEADVRSGQRVVGTGKPLRTSTIGRAVDGRVGEFLVNDGDLVAKGQTLAQLHIETLQIEQTASEAELSLATNRLDELKNGSVPQDIAEADANRRMAATSLKNAVSKLQRIQALGSAASGLEIGDAKEEANAAKFSLMASEALLDRIKNGPRKEQIAQAAAQVELQKQRLNQIKDRIKKCTIVAPFDGFVASEYTEIGNWINRGDPIVQIIQLDEIEIHAPVTAESVVRLRRGDVIRVEFPELPNEIFTGTIARIVPVAAARARTFPVHIRLKNRIENETPLLLAGMLARVEVPVGQRKSLPLVPKDALVLNGNDRFVYVVESNGKTEGTVRKVPVDLGVAVDNRIQVIGKLKVGDLIVVEGNERLVPDTKVKFASIPESKPQSQPAVSVTN